MRGGSGGALAIGVCDRLMMLQYSTYSVISPEGCASILWRSADKKEAAAEALGITAGRLKQLGLIDELLEEPLGGAHRDPVATAASLKEAVIRHLDELEQLTTEELLARRAAKLAASANFPRPGRSSCVPQRGLTADPAWVYSQLLRLYPQASSAPLCVAFSGGEDSSALLGMLAQQVPGRLRAFHVDHGLHPDSQAWARVCRATCRVLGLPFAQRRVAVPRRRGQSLEAAARDARYAALAAALAPGEVLLTAHHLDDQLETVLLQLLRGAGLPGLAAMPAVMPFGTGVLVRPLLEMPRAALRAWVRARGLACVADPANADDGFDRNFLRAPDRAGPPRTLARRGTDGEPQRAPRCRGTGTAGRGGAWRCGARRRRCGAGSRIAAGPAAGAPAQRAALLDRAVRARAGYAAAGGDCHHAARGARRCEPGRGMGPGGRCSGMPGA